MANVLVRDLPDDVHDALRRKADRRSLSLQQYLTDELRRLAEREQVADVLADVETQRGGVVGLDQAAQDLDGERTQG